MLALSLSPLLVFEVRNDPTPKDKEQKGKEQKGTYNTKITGTSFLLLIHRRFTANCSCTWHSRVDSGPDIAGAFRGKTSGGGTSGDARYSTSSARAPHPQSPGGPRRAWRHSPPEKGLPTLRRAYSSQTDHVSVTERGLLLEAPGGGLAGYDSGGVLAGSELIAPSPDNESPRGN